MDDFATTDILAGNQTGGSMPFVFMFYPSDAAWLGYLLATNSLQGLDAGLFVHTDQLRTLIRAFDSL